MQLPGMQGEGAAAGTTAATGVEFDPSADPVLCSPFAEPRRHWSLDRTGRARTGVAPEPGRRPSMLISPVPDDEKSGTLQLALDDVQLNDGINAIRERVSAWRDGGYQGATSVTVRLLEHWADERGCRLRPFFAQREAIETLVWLREVATRQTAERRRNGPSRRCLSADRCRARHTSDMATVGATARLGAL